jgi:hypothetical protein
MIAQIKVNMEPESNPDSENPLITVHTYHCICHTLILAAHHALESLPTRASAKDGAIIVAPTSQAKIVHAIEDGKAMIIRREDGFEKRTLVKCERCRLVVAYRLDADHFEDNSQEEGKETLYVLPGALVDTAGMMADKTPEVPAWAGEVS